MSAGNGTSGRCMLKRPIPQTPPTVGLRAEKNPTESGWVLGEWWCSRPLSFNLFSENIGMDSNA